VSDAHLVWVERMSQAVSKELFVKQREWTARLDAERHNVGAAITHALDQGRSPAATGIVSRLAFYWFTARRDEGEVWTERVLRSEPADPVDRARALLAAGMVRCDSFENHEVPALLEEARDLFRAAGNERAVGNSLFWLGRARAIRNDVEGARACFEEGAEIHEKLGDLFGLGWCRVWLAIITRSLDHDLERSRELAEDVLALGEAHGIPHIVGAALGELSSIAADRGDRAAARRHLSEAIDLYRMVGDRWQEATLMTVHAMHGDPESAPGDVADIIEAMQIQRELHAVVNVISCLALAAHHLARAGRRDVAALLLGAATARNPEVFTFSSVPTLADQYGQLQSMLDDPSLTNEIGRGRTMAFDAVVDLAIDELGQLYPTSASTST
jgi:tetratricopeptide (TPR) repeat protein